MKIEDDLRPITQGRGSFEMQFDRYTKLPAHVPQEVIAEAQKAAAG